MSTTQQAPANGATNGSPPTPELPSRVAGLAGKIAWIAGAVGAITRDGEVKGNRGFTYATVNAMAGALTPLMAAAGLAMIPTKVDVRRAETIEDEKYGLRWLTEVMVTWTLTDGVDSFEVPMIGKSVDSNGSEKDANQAISFSRINAYKSIFHIAADEDPEKKGKGGGGAAPQHSGELPTVTDATVSGTVVLSPDGTEVGLQFEASPREAQQEINRFVTGVLGGRWQKDAKVYAVPAGKAAQAVVLARHIGLEIPEAVAAKFPRPEPAPAEQPAAGGQTDEDPGE